MSGSKDAPRGHTEECRKRIESMIRDDPRIKKAKQRQDEFLSKAMEMQVEKDEKKQKLEEEKEKNKKRESDMEVQVEKDNKKQKLEEEEEKNKKRENDKEVIETELKKSKTGDEASSSGMQVQLRVEAAKMDERLMEEDSEQRKKVVKIADKQGEKRG
jgi:hypothetical protein